MLVHVKANLREDLPVFGLLWALASLYSITSPPFPRKVLGFISPGARLVLREIKLKVSRIREIGYGCGMAPFIEPHDRTVPKLVVVVFMVGVQNIM